MQFVPLCPTPLAEDGRTREAVLAYSLPSEEAGQDDLDLGPGVVERALERNGWELADMGWSAFLVDTDWPWDLWAHLGCMGLICLSDKGSLDHLCSYLWRRDCSWTCTGGALLEAGGRQWDLGGMRGSGPRSIACGCRRSTEDMGWKEGRRAFVFGLEWGGKAGWLGVRQLHVLGRRAISPFLQDIGGCDTSRASNKRKE